MNLSSSPSVIIIVRNKEIYRSIESQIGRPTEAACKLGLFFIKVIISNLSLHLKYSCMQFVKPDIDYRWPGVKSSYSVCLKTNYTQLG